MMVSFAVEETEDSEFPYEVHLSMRDPSIRGDWLERNQIYQRRIDEILEWLTDNIVSHNWTYYDMANTIFFKQEVDIVAMKLRWE